MKKRSYIRLAVIAAVLLAALCGCSAETPQNTAAAQQVSSGDNVESVAGEVVFGGHSYTVFPANGADWDEIRESCEQQGGYLASITSEEENLFLYKLCQNKGYEAALFGLYRDTETGEWKWVSGESADYTCWQEGEPNNSTGVEYYGMFYPGFEKGHWNDGDRNDIEAYICEWN